MFACIFKIFIHMLHTNVNIPYDCFFFQVFFCYKKNIETVNLVLVDYNVDI